MWQTCHQRLLTHLFLKSPNPHRTAALLLQSESLDLGRGQQWTTRSLTTTVLSKLQDHNCNGLEKVRRIIQIRNAHSESSGPFLPPLMDAPNRTWPRLLNSIRNWFFVYFVIKPYMDREFDLDEFLRGAKEAVQVVSSKLMSGEFDDLKGLVEDNALVQIKHSLANFTVFQRNLLSVTADDIFFCFPYQIGIMIPEPVRQEGDKILPQTRHVEITVVLHVLRGFAKVSKDGGDTKTFQDFIQDKDTKFNVMICNYRFFRDFTEGSRNPEWIINLVNHFLPADQVNLPGPGQSREKN